MSSDTISYNPHVITKNRLFRISRAQASRLYIGYTTGMRTFVFDAAATELFATLVPEVTVIEAERTTSGLVLTAVSHSLGASCPRCEALSTRVHSYYTRHPHDLPICGQPLQLVLHLRRFRCLNPACSAVTFTERLPELIAPSAQRTARLNELLRGLALAFGVKRAHDRVCGVR